MAKKKTKPSTSANNHTIEKGARKNENIQEAHKQADKDIEWDPELTSKPGRGDDLDEGNWPG